MGLWAAPASCTETGGQPQRGEVILALCETCGDSRKMCMACPIAKQSAQPSRCLALGLHHGASCL